MNVVAADGDSIQNRRAQAAMAGHLGDSTTALTAISDSEPSIRLLGFGALDRLGLLDDQHASVGLSDPDTRVVRRVIESVAAMPSTGGTGGRLDAILVGLLNSTDDSVAETAAWALGERHQQTDQGPRTDIPAADQQTIVDSLAHATVGHQDALVRESAAAALGAIGLAAGLPAILTATQDKATVRRRAVLALASFDGPEVTAALQLARTDRDWQVRQAAEDLLRGQ